MSAQTDREDAALRTLETMRAAVRFIVRSGYNAAPHVIEAEQIVFTEYAKARAEFRVAHGIK